VCQGLSSRYTDIIGMRRAVLRAWLAHQRFPQAS
jgi:hypothetical protein